MCRHQPHGCPGSGQACCWPLTSLPITLHLNPFTSFSERCSWMGAISHEERGTERLQNYPVSPPRTVQSQAPGPRPVYWKPEEKCLPAPFQLLDSGLRGSGCWAHSSLLRPAALGSGSSQHIHGVRPRTKTEYLVPCKVWDASGRLHRCQRPRRLCLAGGRMHRNKAAA